MRLKVQMRYSLPLFVYGQGIQTWLQGAHHARVDTAKLHWRVVRADGQPQQEVRNDNNVHVRLSKVMLRQGGAQHTMAQGLLGYVLPGSTRRWPLPAAARCPRYQSASGLSSGADRKPLRHAASGAGDAAGGGVLC